jgi:hypothetical protein
MPYRILLVVVVLRRNSIDCDDDFEPALRRFAARSDDGPLSGLPNQDHCSNSLVPEDLLFSDLAILECIRGVQAPSQCHFRHRERQ